MKLLLVSMPSIHVIRWVENLKDEGIDLYWFDILNRSRLDTDIQIHQISNWKKRKIPHIKGEYWLSKKVPKLYARFQPYLEVTIEEKMRQILQEIQPDMVHSFEMQSCSIPILKVMKEFPNVKWIYSCWGNDLFHYQNFPRLKVEICSALQRIDYLHTDCQRDHTIALQLGFRGKYMGVIPGGTGYKLNELQHLKRPHSLRKIILVKGYEHHFGRGLNIVKALHGINKHLSESQLEVVVFGAHQPVIDYIIQNQLNYTYSDRTGLSHDQLLELMGKSLIYVGNSISDGMANTLLEAIVLEAFPIQSNPGNVTAELIENYENGILIENPNSVEELQEALLRALNSKEMLENALVINRQIAITKLDYDLNKLKVIDLYKKVEGKLCE